MGLQWVQETSSLVAEYCVLVIGTAGLVGVAALSVRWALRQVRGRPRTLSAFEAQRRRRERR